MFSYVLPFPPSVNNYWRAVNGRMLISERGREFRSAVHAAVLSAGWPPRLSGRLAVLVAVHAPDRARRDLDNLGKALLDALEKAGVYRDDGQIDDLRIVRCARHKPAGKVVVTVEELTRGDT